MLSYTYNDPMLKDLVSQNNEDMAVIDMFNLNPDFTQADLDQLVPYRAYILCCIDSVKDANDIFSVKKKFYEGEFKSNLILARSKDSKGVTSSIFSIPIERC